MKRVLALIVFALCAAAWPADSVGGIGGTVLREVALPGHFDDFAKGLVTGQDLAYFLSLTALGLFVARAFLASQRWR